MNLGWLALIGAFLLVAGLCTLAYDSMRRKKGNLPYPFPDASTNRLEDTAVQLAPPVGAAKQTPRSIPHFYLKQKLVSLLSSSRRPSTPVLAVKGVARTRPDFLTRLLLAIPRRAIALMVVCSVALIVMSVAVLVAGAGTQAPNAGRVVIAVGPFGAQTAGIQAANGLADYIRRSAFASGLGTVEVRTTKTMLRNNADADAERARLNADILITGDVGADGTFTASIILAPNFTAGRRVWQQFLDPDLSVLLLPRENTVYLGTRSGSDPLVPLSLALSYLKLGNYKSAADAAWGAQETLNEMGATGQFARLLEAQSRYAQGDYGGALKAITQIEQAGSLTDEGILIRAAAKFYLLDFAGASDDCNSIIGDRNAADIALSRAYLLRARARYSAGDLPQAIADLNESARLDTTNLRVRLDKAEVYYRQAKPNEAAQELDALLKTAPDAAPAYRLMGLVRLMLGQPEEALKPLGAANQLYTGWLKALRGDEAQATSNGDSVRSTAATENIVKLNKELAGVALYEGMAWADIARKEPKESFLGGIWRGMRGEPATWERGLAKMQEASRLDPRRPDIPLQIGSLYTQQGDFASASRSLEQARDLDPSAPEPYMALARLQEAQGRNTEAVATLQQLRGRAPRYYPAYDRISSLYNAKGEKDAAQGALEQAIAITPQTMSDRLWRGKFLLKLGRLDEAEADLRVAGQDPALWEAHLLLGRILLDAGRGPEALTEYQAVLQAQPNNEIALLEAGRLLVLAGRQDDAQTLFERLATIAPANVEGHIALLELYIAKGALDKAVAEGQRAVAADANRSDTHYFLGLAYDAGGKWSQATLEYASAVQRDPGNFQALLSLGRSLFKEDRYMESAQTADKAIAMRRDDPRPYRWKAESQIALGDIDGALGTLGALLRLRNDDADALALTSRAYAAKGDENSAIGYANQATNASPTNAAGRLALGDLYMTIGRPQDALAAYGSALDIGDYHSGALAMVGEARAYALLGDANKALQLLSGAADKDKQAGEPYFYIGHIYDDAMRSDDALSAYHRAVELRPNWPLGLYYLGKAYLQRKDLPNASAALAKAVDHGPNLVDAWFTLGIAQRGQNHSTEAINALSKATQLNQNFAEAWLYLGLSYEEVGKRVEAADAFSKAITTTTNRDIQNQAEQGLARVK